MLILAWISKIGGLISLVVLARLLTPADFGVLAAVLLVQKFSNVISNVSSQHYILRKPEISDNNLNNCWTFNVLTKFGVSILLASSAHFIASYFKIDALYWAILSVSFTLFIGGFANTAMYRAEKNLDFFPRFIMLSGSRFLSLIVTISVAYVYRSYWAVIVGEFVFILAQVIVSYLLFSYRPKFAVNEILEQWQFSRWLYLKGIFNYFKVFIDGLIVTKNFDLASIGFYRFGKEIAFTPNQIIVAPLNSVLYSSFTNNQDPKILAERLCKTTFCILACITPICFGIIALSEQFIPLLFGEKWISAKPILNSFALLALSATFSSTFIDMFTVAGRVKGVFIFELCTTAVLFFALYQNIDQGIEQLAMLRTALGYCFLLILYIWLNRVIPLPPIRMVKLLFIPIISAASMFLVIVSAKPIISNSITNEWLNLSMLIFVGAAVYISMFFVGVKLFASRISEVNFFYQNVLLKILTSIRKSTLFKRA